MSRTRTTSQRGSVRSSSKGCCTSGASVDASLAVVGSSAGVTGGGAARSSPVFMRSTKRLATDAGARAVGAALCRPAMGRAARAIRLSSGPAGRVTRRNCPCSTPGGIGLLADAAPQSSSGLALIRAWTAVVTCITSAAPVVARWRMCRRSASARASCASRSSSLIFLMFSIWRHASFMRLRCSCCTTSVPSPAVTRNRGS